MADKNGEKGVSALFCGCKKRALTPFSLHILEGMILIWWSHTGFGRGRHDADPSTVLLVSI